MRFLFGAHRSRISQSPPKHGNEQSLWIDMGQWQTGGGSHLLSTDCPDYPSWRPSFHPSFFALIHSSHSSVGGTEGFLHCLSTVYYFVFFVCISILGNMHGCTGDNVWDTWEHFVRHTGSMWMATAGEVSLLFHGAGNCRDQLGPCKQ